MNNLLLFMSKILSFANMRTARLGTNDKFFVEDGAYGGALTNGATAGADASNKVQDSQDKIGSISEKIEDILRGIAGPILIAIGSIGVIYMIVLGVQYAKSENEEKRATVKRRLVNMAIGVVVIFALGAVCLAINWEKIVPELFGYMDAVKH